MGSGVSGPGMGLDMKNHVNKDHVELLDIGSMCELLKIKRTTFHRVRTLQDFPRAILVGGRKRWLPGDVFDWQSKQRRVR